MKSLSIRSAQIIPAVMIGGAGSRLWPLSRTNKPKQFLSFSDGAPTLFQQTLKRFDGTDFARPWLMSSKDTVNHALDQAGSAKQNIDGLIVEPCMQGTAAAIAALSHIIANHTEHGAQAVVLVAPSDHLIKNAEKFRQTVVEALPVARDEKRIVTFGIKPETPETGFGYIKPGRPITVAEQTLGYTIERGGFFEKPDRKTAETFLQEGFCWNAGIFMFRVDVMREELQRYAPETTRAAENAASNAQFQTMRSFKTHWLSEAEFQEAPQDVPIDKAVLEVSDKGAVVPSSNIGWSDIGSMSALYDAAESKDETGNALSANVLTLQSRNNFTRSSTQRRVVLIGMENTVVIDDDDALLIAKMDKSQAVKDAVKLLKESGLPECKATLEQLFDWGCVEILSTTKHLLVYRLRMGAFSSVSLMTPTLATETWTAVGGTLEANIADEVCFLEPQQSLVATRRTRVVLSNNSPDEVSLIVLRHLDAIDVSAKPEPVIAENILEFAPLSDGLYEFGAQESSLEAVSQ